MSGLDGATVSRSRVQRARRRLPRRRAHVLLDDLMAAWSRAFTLVELLIVVALLGTIVAIALPAYFDALDKARVARAIGDIVAVSEEVSLFWFDNGRYPNNLAEIGRGGMVDPYGELYVYAKITKAGSGRKDRFLVPVNSDYDLYSKGKDKQTQLPFTAAISLDDVVRANNGMYIGVAEDF